MGRTVGTSGDDALTVRTDRSSDDDLLVPQDCDTATGPGVPNARGVIVPGGDHPLTVWAEHGVADRVVPQGLRERFSARHVPKPCGAIAASSDHMLAVRTERAVHDLIVMLERRRHRLPADRIPDSGITLD